MSAYYSTQNGIGTPGNFGIARTINVSAQAASANYNYGLNNAGLVPQNAKVNVSSNVMVALSQPAFVSGGQLISMNNVVDDGGVTSAALDTASSNYPVNSINNVVNNNVKAQNYDNNLIAQGAVNIYPLYPNGVAGPGY
jgi:uncharacterized membrane protein